MLRQCSRKLRIRVWNFCNETMHRRDLWEAEGDGWQGWAAVRTLELKDGRLSQKMLAQQDRNNSKTKVLSTMTKIWKEEAKQIILAI